VFRGAPAVPHRASAARRTAGTQRRLPWGSFPLDGSSFDLLMRRFTSPAPLRSQGSSPSQRISRSLVALFHATSASRIRPSGLFPSRQPHVSRRRCSRAVEVSAGHPVPPSVEPPAARAPSLVSSDSPRCRFRLRSTSSPVQTVKTADTEASGCPADRRDGCDSRSSELDPRRALSAIPPKSVDPRLQSLAPSGHPYLTRHVSAERGRCPLDLHLSEVCQHDRWLPSPLAVIANLAPPSRATRDQQPTSGSRSDHAWSPLRELAQPP